MRKLSLREEIESFKERYPEAIIKNHDRTVEFSFPYTVSISFTSLFMNNTEVALFGNNNTADLFRNSPMELIMKMGYYKVPDAKKRRIGYTDWMTEAFCNIYKFNIQRVATVDIERNVLNCDAIVSHKVNRVIKGNKPQRLYIEKDEDNKDTNVIIEVNLNTGGFLYVSQLPATNKDNKRGGKKFNKKKAIAVAGIISGSIKKRNIEDVIEEEVFRIMNGGFNI